MPDPSTDSKEPVVIIKPLAYLKMLTHVLRWGSIAKKKSQFKECMGMLMGKLGATKGTVKDVTIVDVVPMTHGGHIEVAFENQDYVAFAEINAKYAEQGIFNVGWYHSHPGLTMFLSTVDVRNHLGFQTTNPSAIAIVWDHQFLEEPDHNGFDTFRLTELGKGQYSDYKSVKTIVETPDSMDFYKLAIKNILDMQQSGNPAMLEVNELPNVLGDFDPTPIEESKFVPPKYSGTPFTMPAKIGNAELTSKFLQPLSDFLNNWAKDLAQSLKNKNVVFNQNFSKLKESLEKGMKDLQLWFLNEAYEDMSKTWEKFDDQVEKEYAKSNSGIKAISESFPVNDKDVDLMKLSIEELLSRVKTAKAKGVN